MYRTCRDSQPYPLISSSRSRNASLTRSHSCAVQITGFSLNRNSQPSTACLSTPVLRFCRHAMIHVSNATALACGPTAKITSRARRCSSSGPNPACAFRSATDPPSVTSKSGRWRYAGLTSCPTLTAPAHLILQSADRILSLTRRQSPFHRRRVLPAQRRDRRAGLLPGGIEPLREQQRTLPSARAHPARRREFRPGRLEHRVPEPGLDRLLGRRGQHRLAQLAEPRRPHRAPVAAVHRRPAFSLKDLPAVRPLADH